MSLDRQLITEESSQNEDSESPGENLDDFDEE